MAYTVHLKPAASRQLKKLSRDIQERIAKKIDGLAINPRPRGGEILEGGERFHRVRVGDYRIIYQVQEENVVVLVVIIGHRREVYRRVQGKH